MGRLFQSGKFGHFSTVVYPDSEVEPTHLNDRGQLSRRTIPEPRALMVTDTLSQTDGRRGPGARQLMNIRILQ